MTQPAEIHRPAVNFAPFKIHTPDPECLANFGFECRKRRTSYQEHVTFTEVGHVIQKQSDILYFNWDGEQGHCLSYR